MGIFFSFIYRFFKRFRILFILLLVSMCAFFGYYATQLPIEEDITKMMPADAKVGRINNVFSQMKMLDRIVVTISLKDTSSEPDPEQLKAFADSFVTSVKAIDTSLVKDITYQVNDDLMYGIYQAYLDNLPVFLQEHDYQTLEKLIQPEQLDSTLERNYKVLLSPSSMVLKNNVIRDPIGISPYALKGLESLQLDDNFELDDGYIMTKDRKHLMCFITPVPKSSETDKNKVLLSILDTAISRASAYAGKARAEYFGSAVVAVGNAERIEKDVKLTVGMTILILFLFIIMYYRRISVFFYLFIPVVFGAIFSLAMLYLVRGHVSVIALGAGSIVLGIAIDFSIHFYNHFLHTRSSEETIKDLSFPLTIGGITTIGAFLSLLFIKSEALQDFGFFAAFSLIGAALFILIFFPHILRLTKGKERKNGLKWLDKVASYPYEKNRYLIIGIVIVSIISLFTAGNVEFEGDMMKMNYMSEKVEKAEKNLNAISNVALKSVYLVNSGKTIDEALVNSEKNLPKLRQLKQEGILEEYSSVNNILISQSEQEKRIRRWQEFWTLSRKQILKKDLINKSAAYKFKPDAFNGFYASLDTAYKPINISAFDEMRSSMLDNYISENNGKAIVVTILKCTADKEEKVFKAFEDTEHQVVFDRKFLTDRFVQIIADNFNLIVSITSLLVLVVLIISYGSLELAFITYISMVLSWVIILGLMGLFGLKFNIINIIISTFIFGLGDDYSIFITDALQTEYKTGRKLLANYKTSILMSAITTVIGIGVLIFAKHPALQSIGLISIIGILSVVLISNTIQPALFKLFITNRTERKRVPFTFLNVMQSIFAFAYFCVGCILMMSIGFVIMKLLPIPLKSRKRIFHRLRSAFTWTMSYVNVHVKKKIINSERENFDKPSVVICNHHSVIDSLLMQSLSPKLILMVNDWVWDNPFMGPVVRLGGFIPKSAGYEENLDKIRELVKEGYSLVIFPEGSRSETVNIGRFHKGAFYIAEKLELDIVPIIFHGTAFVQGKDDNFLLKKGRITVKFLPRIAANDTGYGDNFSARTKNISRYFKAEYAQMRQEIETVDYYYNRLSKNYIYKGPVQEWYMKIKVSMEDNYKLFESLLPKKGTITDIGCGYGFLSYMLSFMSHERKILGIDYDEKKIEVANNCFSRSENVSFIAADATEYDLSQSDAFILSDILHYLPAAEQERLIVRCVSKLNEGGMILLRDADNDLKGRHWGTRYTEFMSTNFGFNKTKNKLEFVSGEFIFNIAERYGLELERIDNTKLTSNIIYIIRKKK